MRGLDDADSLGLVWETSIAAANLLSLPKGMKPSAAGEVRARGAGALEALLRGAPGGEDGPIARRPDVRRLKNVLGVQ